MTTTPTSGAADLPEALRRSTAADGKTELFNLPGYPLMVRAVDFNRLHTESEMRRTVLLDEMQKAALAAGQATAAQPGVVYAELPVPNYPKSGGFPGTFAEAQMHAFADATCALREPHGQAPAPAQPDKPIACSYGDNGYACCEGGPCQADVHNDKLAEQQAPATAQAGEVCRAELVPGVMHCAKCKFQLNRVTLCVSDGNAYAGNNKTEPCPNGCGPLWPVTWEQEAKNCWKALEEMHERLMAAAAPQPSPTAQADSVPAVEREQERIAFKDAHRHLELYEVPDAWGRPMFKHSHVEASWLGWIARASHGQAPAGAAQADSVPAVSDLPPLPAPDLRDVGTKPQEIKEFLKGYATEYARTAIAARAQADSVQEDAALWHWLAEYLVGARTDLDDEIVACETVNDLRNLVEAAIKQGEKQ